MLKRFRFSFDVAVLLAAGLLVSTAGRTSATAESEGQINESPNTRVTEHIIRFSGYEWTVKDSADDKVGPGPNYFSRDCERLDTNGWLHLKIQQRGGEPHCAEITSRQAAPSRKARSFSLSSSCGE